MSETTDDNILDTEAQERIRVELKRIAGGRPMTQIAEEAGVAYGTFSAWIGGKYAGNTHRIATIAQQWIDAQGAKKTAMAHRRKAPGYVETPTGRLLIDALQHAQFAPDVVIVTGGSGIGKTTALERHQAATPNVWVLTGEPCFSTPRMVLDRLAKALGITEKYSSETVSAAIVDFMRGTAGLLVVDEAQHLSNASLDQLRTLHDRSAVGVALVGNETVATRFASFARQAQFAQLSSRIGMRISRPKPSRDDVALVLDAWGIEGAELRRTLVDIGMKPGAQRVVRKVLQMAFLLAGSEPVTIQMVRRVYEQISGAKLVSEGAA